MSKIIYAANHPSFIDKIVANKRMEIITLIKKKVHLNDIVSCLDVGTTEDFENTSSNIIIKNFSNIKIRKSLSNQNINTKFFNTIIKKSITDDFTNEEINILSSDLVISSATIEHVGSNKNQIKMIKNIIDLSNKYFIITTPNRFHPIDFHTKLPLLHWLPKPIHRIILKIIGFKYFSDEEKLNLLSKKDLIDMINKVNYNQAEILVETINLFGFVSNFIIFGRIKTNI